MTPVPGPKRPRWLAYSTVILPRRTRRQEETRIGTRSLHLDCYGTSAGRLERGPLALSDVRPSGDTGDFWLDEPRSFVDATALEMVCKISLANIAAGRILAEAMHDGHEVFLREDDRSWPKVEGFHPMPQPRL